MFQFPAFALLSGSSNGLMATGLPHSEICVLGDICS